jgi:small GTP-binding protein
MRELTFQFDALDRRLTEDLLLIHNEPGIDTFPFLKQAADAYDGTVIVLSTQLGPERIREQYGENIWVIDAVSDLLGRKSPHEKDFHVNDAANIAAIIAKAEAVAHQLPGSLLIIDSLSGMAMRGQPAHFQAHGGSILQLLDRVPAAICVHTDWHDGSDGIRDLFRQHLALQGIREKIQTKQFFKVEHPDLGEVSGSVLYRISPVGLQAYVPKLVVAGPPNAGKTTFIHTVSQVARSAEFNGVTVGIDRGIIEQDGLRIELFGAPGHERFAAMAGPMIASAVGLLVVIDSTKPESFCYVQPLLESAKKEGKAIIIAANKQDLSGAVAPLDIAAALSLPPQMVVPCKAAEEKSAKEVLKALVEAVMEI